MSKCLMLTTFDIFQYAFLSVSIKLVHFLFQHIFIQAGAFALPTSLLDPRLNYKKNKYKVEYSQLSD